MFCVKILKTFSLIIICS